MNFKPTKLKLLISIPCAIIFALVTAWWVNSSCVETTEVFLKGDPRTLYGGCSLVSPIGIFIGFISGIILFVLIYVIWSLFQKKDK